MKIRKMMIRCMIFVLLLCGCVIPTINVKAANGEPESYVGHLRDGIDNVFIYFDYASGAGYWEYLFKDAVYNWMYTGYGANPFYASYVSSNNGSHIDVYARPNKDFDIQGTAAETQHFFANGDALTYDDKVIKEMSWYYADIYLNDDELRKDSISNAKATGIMAHEIGHVFGFMHNNTNQYSIMCQTVFNRQVEKVQKVDHDALNKKY